MVVKPTANRDSKDLSDKVHYNIIYQGRAVDLWSMTWKDAEIHAKGEYPCFPEIWAVAAALFSRSKVLYARSESDRQKFDQLNQHVENTVSNSDGNIQLAFNSFNERFRLSRVKLE